MTVIRDYRDELHVFTHAWPWQTERRNTPEKISLLKKVEPQSTPIYYYLIVFNSQWKVFHKVCIGEVFRTTETNAVLARFNLKWHHNSFFHYTKYTVAFICMYHLPKELIFWAESLRAMGLGTVERFLSRVTECVEPELVLWAEEGTAHQTLVPTASPFPLPLFLVLCLSFRSPWSGTSKHFGGASSFLVLQRQCGNMVWGIGGSCCHGSPRVPLPLKLGRGCLAFQALVRYRGDV